MLEITLAKNFQTCSGRLSRACKAAVSDKVSVLDITLRWALANCFVVAFLLSSLFALAASAQQIETIPVASRSVPDEALLAGEVGDAPEVMLDGRLTLPGDQERYPVVILLHGTDGKNSGASYSWEGWLPTLSVATFALDSYTGRGLAMVSFNQESFGQIQQTYDAFRAVEALAAHPRVDPERIVVMGFSRGGQAALYTAMTRFQEAFGPERGRIVAHVAFYPACNLELERASEVGPVPIRLFHGDDDDWTAADTCRDYIERLAAAGHDAAFTGYRGARHGFDNEFAESLQEEGGAESSRDCRRIEAGGRILNAETGAPFSYDDACVARGTSVQYDPAAAAEARAAVERLVATAFAAH